MERNSHQTEKKGGGNNEKMIKFGHENQAKGERVKGKLEKYPNLKGTGWGKDKSGLALGLKTEC